MSAIILDTTDRLPNDVFWFLQPSQPEAETADDPGLSSPWIDWVLSKAAPKHHRHSNRSSCDDFIWQGCRTYWNIGLVMEIVRIGFGSFAQIRSSPGSVLVIMATRMRFRLILFLVGYATAYRVQCAIALRCVFFY